MDNTNDVMEQLKFPTGRFTAPSSTSQEDRARRISIFESLPDRLDQALVGFSDAMYDTPYREGGWTVRQLVHHIADSHLNCFCRFKLALTENKPQIKGYDQAAWADMVDAQELDPAISLAIIRGIHIRLTKVLKNMNGDDFNRLLEHNEWENDLSLDVMLALYAWHCNHHLAHITRLKDRMGWT